MFVFGLVVGPLVSLLLYYLFVQSGGLGRGRFLVLFVLLLLLVLFLGFVRLELRVGLDTGLALGLLLATTPATRFSGDAPETSGPD